MEIIRYSPIGKEDLSLGTGTFEVRLADGRVVVMTKIDVGALLNDAAISTQNLSLGALTLTGLTVSGTLTLGSVTFTGAFDLTSGQLKFPATQVPSTNANTLDDYQEFDWTPSVGGTATYTAQTGKGIKIGRSVFFTGNLTINTIGTGSTTVITGLDTGMIAQEDSAIAVSYTENLATAVTSIGAYVGASTSPIAIYLYSRTAAAVSNSAFGVLGDGSVIKFGGWYESQS